MQKTLTLTITDPAEEQELDAALHAGSFMCVISETLNQLRSVSKYGEDAQEARFADKVREDIWKLVREYDLERFFA